MKEITFKASDGYELSLALYEAKNSKGIILIMHGMEEHKERYEWFAKNLENNGYTVCAADMRGHGKSADVLGYFDKKKGAQKLMNDYTEITQFLTKTYPLLPIYLFAHSMGTITARAMLQNHSFDYKKVILSGYPNYNAATPIAIFLCKTLCLIKGPKGHSKMLDNMCVGAFNKKIKNPKTNLDWLSYDEENIKNYIDDPLSGVPFTVSGYKDLMILMKKMHRKGCYKGINTCLPIYCISGEDDPCAGGEKGRSNSIATLRAQGFSMVQVKTYKNMRHEILNEKDKEKVLEDILNFLEN